MSFQKKLQTKYKVTAASSAETLAAGIKAAFLKHFPHSLVISEFDTKLGSYIRVRFSLVHDTNKLPNGIRDNDPAFSAWSVSGFDKSGEGTGLKAEIVRGGSFSIKSEPGSYMAMGSVKLGWRNKSGTADQILKHFDAYAAKSKKIMQDNIENVYGSESQKEIYKSHL